MTRNIVLFDLPGVHDQLLPLSYTRPVADFLLGTCTLREKWEALLPGQYSYFTAPYLSEKYPMAEAPDTLRGWRSMLSNMTAAWPRCAPSPIFSA